MKVKVFCWNDVVTLASAIEGQVIAYANSKEEAIDMALEDAPSRIKDKLRLELESTEPSIYEEPMVFVIWGSD